MLETWIFAGRTFSIIDCRDRNGSWWVTMDGALLLTRQGDRKPNRLQIHAAAFSL